MSVQTLRMLSPVMLLAWLILSLQFSSSSGVCPSNGFRRQQIRMCLRPELVRNVSLPAPQPLDGVTAACALLCVRRGGQCRGFQTLTDSPTSCRLFEFDKCSHEPNVANCSSATTWAFVREQPGLPPGRLCPEGFAYDRLGSKYKVIAATNWTDGLTKCTAEAGQLVKYSDGWNSAEIAHMHWIKSNANANKSMFIGGQRPGALATDVWNWVACGDSFKPEVWGPGQPNEGPTRSKANLWSTHTAGVDDSLEEIQGNTAALCECLDPFY